MKRTLVLLAITAALFALSWFVPVVEGGTRLTTGGLPGWEAFRVALSPIWPYEWLERSHSFLSDFTRVVSGLTNFWFLASLVTLAFGPPRLTHVVFWGLVLAALINALWLLPSDRGDLRIGYYLWLGSFIALAAVARSILLRARRSSEPSSAA